jgi:alkylation response protein AidB-like acyl-CoA dehydrogenase
MMATATITKPAAKGGSFLLETPLPQEVFTPADLTDDQKLIGQTAEEFVVKEVLPLVKELENKKPGLMPELVKKAGELGLLSGGIPEQYGGAGLDKIAATVLTEKLSIYGGFAVTARTRVSEPCPSFISETRSRRKNICPNWRRANGSAHIVFPSRRRVRTRRTP